MDPLKGMDLVLSFLLLLMPILNVAVLQILSSPGRALHRIPFVGNILWLALAFWVAATRLPSHPGEAGLIESMVLLRLTPLLSAVALVRYSRLSAKSSSPPLG